MNARICAAFLMMSLTGTPALAKEPPPAPGLFEGTPEEQAACSPDAKRFCKDAIPDTFRVLACLQDHREKLHKRCRIVLEGHGQ